MKRNRCMHTVRSRTMAINASEISCSNQGRHPAAPPVSPSLGEDPGPKRDFRTCKGVCLRPAWHRRYRSAKCSCQRHACSDGSRCVNDAIAENQIRAPSRARRSSKASSNRSLHPTGDCHETRTLMRRMRTYQAYCLSFCRISPAMKLILVAPGRHR